MQVVRMAISTVVRPAMFMAVLLSNTELKKSRWTRKVTIYLPVRLCVIIENVNSPSKI